MDAPAASELSPVLAERRDQVVRGKGAVPACGKKSAAGSVSQRACTFCGSRVVLYPVADALHVVHGPIGCAAYTWDIRGALSSGPELHRHSFCTDLRERDVVFGGEPKLERMLLDLTARLRPKAAFIYPTCIAGVIGDDVAAVCRRVGAKTGITMLAVASEGFKGTKKDGYAAACDAILALCGTLEDRTIPPLSINLLGEFNLAGETWILRKYFEDMGLRVVAVMTGDGRVDDIRRSHRAALNVVQCSGSMTRLAQEMERRWGIPYIRASFFGIEDTARALYDVADHFKDPALRRDASHIVRAGIARVQASVAAARGRLAGKRAAIYVGGAFKAVSLVKSLRALGMVTVVAGSQTGGPEDYAQLSQVCGPETVLVDDTNPVELGRLCRELGADLLIGGVKERPIAAKLGLGFCDHNHERKIPLAGFEGMVHFAEEVTATVNSGVWETLKNARARQVALTGERT